MREQYGTNEVGAIWCREKNGTRYLSIAIDLDRLYQMRGGETGEARLVAYPILFHRTKTNLYAPDYRIKFFATAARTLPLDEETPVNVRPNEPNERALDPRDVPGTRSHRENMAKEKGWDQ
jgi:hypothetical protein